MPTPRKNVEELLEGRQLRRMKEEDRFVAKLDRQHAACEPLIGELNREGRTVYYINRLDRQGRLTGKTAEFPMWGAAADYLIRNHYV